ncbi:MAG: hypothetical protein J6C66_07515, partial [Prevotella sp.]|nr:hypothetical protein [Prevotella sp.]
NTATPKVYDLYDLTGATEKTIYGRIQAGVWDQEIGKVAEADKGNVAFTTKMTVGSSYEHIFIGLGMSGANAASTSDGYIFEIQAKAGEPDVVVYHKKDAPWQASSQNLTFDFNGTYVLEAGLVDLYQDGALIGKRAYLKANGAEVCHWDDTNPVTTENLGTTVGIYNEQNNIALESTYEQGFGAENVYDIYDLTGAISNSFNGTGNGNWSASVFGNVDAADKENVTFKANVNVPGGNEFRLSVSALDSKDCVDVAGYGLVFHFGMSKLIFARNGSWIASWDMNNADMMGEYELEFGYRDILVNHKTVGKQLFLKKNGEIVHTYDDISGYLTGDALGTKIALFHYGTVAQMNTTYENGYGSANVYDIADLTGATVKNVNPWEATKIGSVSAEHKEQAAVKFNMNMTNDVRHRYRFSLGAQEDADCTDIKGYGMEIGIEFDGQNYVRFQRNSDWIATFNDISGILGEHDFEFGYRNITFGKNIIGKQVYLSVDGVDLYTYDETANYLTGDALGTKIALHHIDDAAVALESTYEIGYATEKVYDISDLTGATTNNFNGTSNGNWSASVFGNVDAADKESFSIKANVSITDGNEFRLSLGALDSKDCVDVTAYGLVLHFGMSKLIFARNGNWDISWDMNNADMMGEYELEFGFRSITLGNRIIGKQIFVKKNGEVLHTYDNMNDYLTGDALGTKVALFHYGTVVKMNSTKECSHNYSAETTNPDCVNAGKTVYTCTLCGDTYEESISALGHSYVAQTTPADCTNDGKTVYTCSACGDSYEEAIGALGHNYVGVVTTPATCTTDGVKTYTC